MSFLIYPREEVTTSGSGRGNNRRRPFRRRESGGQDNTNRRVSEGRSFSRDGQSGQNQNSRGNQRRNNDSLRVDKNRGLIIERLKWSPPKISTEPLPVPDCPWCGKPIRDLASAIADKETGLPVHFDCVAARIARKEILEKGDTVTYIGGGRFGIVHFDGSEFPGRGGDGKTFKIKKIIEWENKDDRAEWRSTVSDHYSVT
jgi:hypothetical protein